MVVSDEDVVETGPKMFTAVVLDVELAVILPVLADGVAVEVACCVLTCSPLGRYTAHSSGNVVACTLRRAQAARKAFTKAGHVSKRILACLYLTDHSPLRYSGYLQSKKRQ